MEGEGERGMSSTYHLVKLLPQTWHVTDGFWANRTWEPECSKNELTTLTEMDIAYCMMGSINKYKNYNISNLQKSLTYDVVPSL